MRRVHTSWAGVRRGRRKLVQEAQEEQMDTALYMADASTRKRGSEGQGERYDDMWGPTQGYLRYNRIGR